MANETQRILLAAVLVAWTGANAADAEPPGECPSPLTLWAVSEQVVPGDTWSFGLLEIEDGFARNRLLEAWFASPKISEEEARWFAHEPAAVVPDLLSVKSHQYEVSELDSLCRSLIDGGIGAVQDAAARFCEAGSSGGDVRASVRHAGHLYGILARPRPDDERCLAGGGDSGDRTAAPTVVIGVETDADPASEDPLGAAAGAVIDSWKTFLSEWPDEEPGLQGLAALPAAGALIDRLMDVEAGLVPEALRSDLHLAVAVGAPRAYTVALALEALERPVSREESISALLLLGDRPAPRAKDDLVRLLRRSREDEEVVALSLRALLKADPAAARMEAIEILDDSADVPPSALGVFALTQVGFDHALESLDLEDHDAVREAAVSLLHRLASGAGDDELRAAASGILERQVGGGEPD
jgi:hypothetical protein